LKKHKSTGVGKTRTADLQTGKTQTSLQTALLLAAACTTWCQRSAFYLRHGPLVCSSLQRSAGGLPCGLEHDYTIVHRSAGGAE